MTLVLKEKVTPCPPRLLLLGLLWIFSLCVRSEIAQVISFKAG